MKKEIAQQTSKKFRGSLGNPSNIYVGKYRKNKKFLYADDLQRR
jgi:hypothetical protein